MRNRDDLSIAFPHKAIEVVNEHPVALATQIAQHDAIGKI